jgi:hypothetical protein
MGRRAASIKVIGVAVIVKLIDVEINHFDWAGIRCACGNDASHLPSALRAALRSGERGAVEESLDSHSMMSTYIHEPAVPLTSVLLAALADDIGPESRVGALEMVRFFVAPDGQSFDAEEAGRDLIEECIKAARKGIWLLYQEIFSGRDIVAASIAFGILIIIETDVKRLKGVRDAAGTLLPERLRQWEPKD